MSRRFVRAHVFFTLFTVSAVPIATALGQSTQGSGESEPRALEEIVVTAQKRAEPLSRVPISVSAQTQQQLDAQGLKNIDDLARTVPGLNSSPGGVLDNNISIRGVLSNVGAATTGVYVDETPVAARYVCFYCGFSAYPQLFDLDRVEVLRGPQGTLFGAGSEGGTIRFITPAPSLQEYTAFARTEAATTQYGDPSYEVGGAVGGPIVEDKLGFRGSMWTRTDGGYVDLVNRRTGEVYDKDSNQQQSHVGRLAVAWKPLEELTITPAFFYQKLELDDRATYWPQAGGQFRSLNIQAQPVDDRQSIASLDVSYEFGGVTLKSITSYYDRKQHRRDDYTPIDLAYYAGVEGFLPNLPDYTSTSVLDTTQKNWTQELRLSSNGEGPLSFTAGLYFAKARSQFHQQFESDLEAFSQAAFGASVPDVFGFPLVDGSGYIETQTQRDEEYAAFGEVSYNFTPELKVALGARVSHYKFTLDLDRDGPLAGGPFTTTRADKATPVTPRASVSYQLENTLLYTSVGKGFRIGGGNSSVANIPFCAADLALLGVSDIPGTYDSDSVWSYEIGAKTRLADGRARLSGSLFWIDWKDIQTNIILPACGYNYTANVGSAVSRGFDLDGTVELLRGLTLNAGVGYTDAQNKKSVVVNEAFLIHDGSSLPLPEWNATVGLQYDFDLFGGVGSYARADYQYSAAYDSAYIPGDISYDPDTNKHEASNYVSLRAGVRPREFDISVFVNNLLDSRPLLSRGHELPGQGEFRDVTLRPRTFGVTGIYRF